MTRRARKSPLLPRLIRGSQKRTYRRSGRVAVQRVAAQPIAAPRLVEDFFLATGVCLGLMLYLVIGVR